MNYKDDKEKVIPYCQHQQRKENAWEACIPVHSKGLDGRSQTSV